MNTLAPHFLDFRTVQGLLPRFGKRSLESLVDQEFAESYERLSVAERAFFLERLA